MIQINKYEKPIETRAVIEILFRIGYSILRKMSRDKLPDFTLLQTYNASKHLGCVCLCQFCSQNISLFEILAAPKPSSRRVATGSRVQTATTYMFNMLLLVLFGMPLAKRSWDVKLCHQNQHHHLALQPLSFPYLTQYMGSCDYYFSIFNLLYIVVHWNK